MGLLDKFQNKRLVNRKMNIEELRRQFMGKPFHLLIEYHIQQGKSKANLLLSGLGMRELLPPSTQNIASEFIDRWNEPSTVYDPQFWQSATSEVFSKITGDAQSILSSANASTDDETLFYFFQIVVLNYAYNAIDQPSMREFIKKPPTTEQAVEQYSRQLDKSIDSLYGEGIAQRLQTDKVFQALALAGGWQSSGKSLERAVKEFEKALNDTLPNWPNMTAQEIADTPQGRAAAAAAVITTR
jgi:hypothetical protein